MNTKYIIFPLVIILIISIAANIYFFNKSDEKNVQEETLSESEYVKNLEMELANVKDTLKVVSKNTDVNVTTETLIDLTELEQTAIKFLEHVYNIDEENYAQMKNSAQQYMSNNLYETLFPADGIDIKNRDFVSEVFDIEIFQHSKEKEAIVKYKVDTMQLSTKNKIEEVQLMYLKFVKKNDRLIVDEIEALSNFNGV